eukprot:9474686-Pyramimonas_sp.AAC.1
MVVASSPQGQILALRVWVHELATSSSQIRHKQILFGGTVGTHAKKHPACLKGALGFLGFDGFAMERVTFTHQTSTDVLGSQGW